MRRTTHPARVELSRVLAFAVLGGLIALVVGLAAVAFAPDNGFADLAAAVVTRILLVPLGIVAGAIAGWLTGRH